MKPIAEVVEALGEIPKALVALDGDPFRSPVVRYPVNETTQQPTAAIDLPDGWDYPDWVEKEIWRPLDGRVRGERTDGAIPPLDVHEAVISQES